MLLLVKRFGHMEHAYGFSPVWIRSCAVAWLWWLNCLGQNEQQKGTVSVAWTRSCCASLPGLRNRFSQCPQACTIALVWRACPGALDSATTLALDTLAAVQVAPTAHDLFPIQLSSWRCLFAVRCWRIRVFGGNSSGLCLPAGPDTVTLCTTGRCRCVPPGSCPVEG